MGRVRVPPLPSRIVLTDRADGTLWILTHEADGSHVGIESTIPANAKDLHTYPANVGPVLPTVPEARLLVRGGFLGYEETALPRATTDRDQARILTRRGVQSIVLEVREPAAGITAAERNMLAFEQVL